MLPFGKRVEGGLSQTCSGIWPENSDTTTFPNIWGSSFRQKYWVNTHFILANTSVYMNLCHIRGSKLTIVFLKGDTSECAQLSPDDISDYNHSSERQ